MNYIQYRFESRMSKMMKANLFVLLILLALLAGFIYSLFQYPLWSLSGIFAVSVILAVAMWLGSRDVSGRD